MTIRISRDTGIPIGIYDNKSWSGVYSKTFAVERWENGLSHRVCVNDKLVKEWK